MKKAKKTSIVPALRFSVLLIALVLLIYGYILGGTADVLTKAVNICTECIGLG
ncbi:MAG: thioredoxin [Clostridia bacterium]|nr:thioredoxin [Clostridia bacterium]